MFRIVFFVIFVLALGSCKQNNTSEKTATKKQAAAPLPNKVENVQGLTPEVMNKLLNEVTYVDYIFHELPFSVSQDNKASVVANIRQISPEPLGYLPSNCKAIGREFFHINGEIEFEADLYFSNGCIGYVFMKNEKPIFANKVSPSGQQFYGNLIAQATQMSKQANGG